MNLVLNKYTEPAPEYELGFNVYTGPAPEYELGLKHIYRTCSRI